MSGQRTGGLAVVAPVIRLQADEDAHALVKTSSPGLVPTDIKDGIGALILGGAHGSLAVARSLGRRGIPVAFLSNDRSLPAFSRYIRQNFFWRGPDQAEATTELLAISREHKLEGWVLYPGGDVEARLISQHHVALSAVFRVMTPAWDEMKWAYDKRLTYERAAALSIGYPKSYQPRGREDISALDCRFPVILKPTVRERRNAFTREKAWRADDRAELIRRYDEAVALVGAEAIVLQEMIPGSGAAQFSYAAVWDRGKPIASLVAQRCRQFPVDFGYTSTLVQTTDNPEVEAAAERFLSSIAFTGLVEVEFKYDARDGQYKILDVNARTWTWAALGAISGVDFPHLLWRIALGDDVPRMRGVAGKSWMLASRDIAAAGQEILRGTLPPSRYFHSLRAPMVFGAFAADDPLPGLIELPLVAVRQARRRISELAGH